MSISLALATYNEETNIAECIQSCKDLVAETIVVDGGSTDKTVDLARQNGAKVIITDNPKMFHINKQKAIDACTGEWILQLDADERVTQELSVEIQKLSSMTNEEIDAYQKTLAEKKLFDRHQSLVQKNWRNQSGSYNAFFIPRLNFFLGGYLRSGGVYPDGVIRLIRKGKAHLPCKDVHELMEVEGRTGWCASPLIHKDSPTFARYLARNSRYIDHLVPEVRIDNRGEMVKCIDWILVRPVSTFVSMLIRHKGILDGWRGVVFAFFSAVRFARAYVRSKRV